MILKPKFLLILSLFQLTLGLGWIIGYLLLTPTVACYEWAATGAMHKEYHSVRMEGLDSQGNIVLQPYEYLNEGRTAQLPVISLHRESALNSFPSYPPNPMDYTVLFRHLFEQGATNVYAIAPMSWDEEPDHIVKAAAGYEFNRFRHKAIGRQMTESSRNMPLPRDWERLAIPESNIVGKTDHFPRADRFVGETPQITSDALVLGTGIENNELFTSTQNTGKSAPLFVRWQDRVLPVLPLIAAMNALDISPSDVKIIPGSMLYLGDKRSIPLDEYGRIPLSEHSSPTILDTKEVIIPIMSGLRPPDTTATRKLLASADAVIVSEPAGLSNTPDHQALLAAQTIRSIMGALSPAPPVLIPVTPAWVQWIIVLDILLLSTWALRFRRKWRFITWGICILSAPALAWYLFVFHQVWFPVMTPVASVICLALAGTYISYFTPPAGDDEETERDEAPPPQDMNDGNGAGHVLPPDTMYHEPNEVPIPHHPQQKGK